MSLMYLNFFSFILINIEHKILILKFVNSILKIHGFGKSMENDRVQQYLSDVWLFT